MRLRRILTRHVMYPVHEWLLGRPTFRELKELEHSQWTAPAAIRTTQGNKVRSLLRHAHAHTRFYRRRFQQVNPDEMMDVPCEAWRCIPTLDKAMIRGAIRDMVWHDSPGGLSASHTGGSTGEPLRFYVDRRRQCCDQAARLRSQRWFGVDAGDRQLFLWGSPIEW